MVTELTEYDAPLHPSSTAEDRWVDFTDALEISGRTIASVTSVTEFTADSETGDTLTSSSDLGTFSESVNGSAITRTNDETIDAGKAVAYRLNGSGATIGTWYHLRFIIVTSSGETIARNVRFKCSAT